MSSVPTAPLTPEEYLAFERRADHKSEYVNGQLFAMAGASRAHNRITTNVTGQLYGQLRGRECEAFGSDMRVKVTATGLYTYPDVTVVCGEPLFEDDEVDTLLNPTVIVEVLSPSTEAYDRGDKFAHFRRLEALREYVLIAQDRHRVEQYTRQPDDRWLLTEVSDPGAALTLQSIGCRLTLSDIYDRVTFEDAGES
jgi:Uma2 family endonuclease